MIIRPMVIWLMMSASIPVMAQADAPASAPLASTITLKADTALRVVTSAPLSSKTSAKGSTVALEVGDDVIVDGQLLIPKGTAVVGEISDARAKAMLGQSGRLSVRPLYLRVGAQIVRLTGETGIKAKTEGGAIVGLALVSPLFTGKNAIIPAGTQIPAAIAHDIALMPIAK